MSDSVLDVLKLVFLALLYLFFLRVIWVVASEVRANRPTVAPGNVPGPVPGMQAPPSVPYAEVPPVPAVPGPIIEVGGVPIVPPTPFAGGPRPKKGKRGAVTRLVMLEPRDRRGTTFPITAELTLGRSNGCTIQVLDDTFVSSVHCRIFRDEAGNAIVEDLGSTNGTYLNGDRIHVPKPLHAGDRVQLGSTIVEVQ
jgi:hypothetical protein